MRGSLHWDECMHWDRWICSGHWDEWICGTGGYVVCTSDRWIHDVHWDRLCALGRVDTWFGMGRYVVCSGICGVCLAYAKVHV